MITFESLDVQRSFWSTGIF